MNKLYILIAALFFFCSCEAQQEKEKLDTSKEEMEQNNNQTQQKEITKPEETEVWEPKPEQVSMNEQGVPSDAIVLFDGSDLSQWESVENEGKPADWIVNSDGSMTVKDQAGNIQTKQSFGDVQLHLEWRNPSEPRADGQNRGNSGVFLQKRYEVQVLDSYDNETYVNGQAAAIYKQHVPLVNASKPSGEWQTYDIIYHAPTFNADGEKTASGTITVLHNGVLVQDHVEMKGTTEYIGLPKNEAHGEAPIMLQDHKDNSGVQYRNIWVRPLD